MHTFFAATGRFAVRFRWLIVAAWLAATILAHQFLPSLASVANASNVSFLPASSPSVQAARLATPFQDINQTAVPVVIARGRGALSAADTTAIARLTARLAAVTAVQRVEDLGVSRDGQAAQLQVLAAINLDAPGPAQDLAVGLRHAIGASVEQLKQLQERRPASWPPRPTPARAPAVQPTWASTCPSRSSWSCCWSYSARCWPRC